ncbi:MAG: IS1 family transposase [Deltaproteobacteria bacterium]|nr:IS1 family transposase [Deltaproteobacteria bacterium]
MANVLKTSKRVAIVSALVQGASIRAISRVEGCSKNTATKLLVDLGTACSEYQDEVLRDLECKRLQIDEIWSFCGMKQKTAAKPVSAEEFGVGDIWTWTAIDPGTKLVPSWMVGTRDTETAKLFIKGVAGRLRQRVQLCIAGHKPYLKVVEDAFGMDIDYAQLVEVYGADPQLQKRYSPADCSGVQMTTVQDDPEEDHISTSCVECQKLTMRMSIRHSTRLNNDVSEIAFSKKVENLTHSVALHFMAYNFVKPHGTLTKRACGHPTTPAMAACVATKAWKIEDVVGLLS